MIMILIISVFLWPQGYLFKGAKQESKGPPLHQMVTEIK